MRQPSTRATFAMLLALLLSGIVPSSVGLPVRSGLVLTSTRIEGDEQFDLLHGVTSGSGTAEDPYVIRDVQLVPAAGHYGLSLVGTRAHVLLEGLVANGIPGDPLVYAHCGDEVLVGCPFTRYIELVDAQNVTIRGFRNGSGPTSGVALWIGGDSRNVLVEDSALSMYSAGYAPGHGVRVFGAKNVTLRDVDVFGEVNALHAEDVVDLTIDGGSYESYWLRPTLLRVQEAVVVGAELPVGLHVVEGTSARIVENRFAGTFAALTLVGSADLHARWGTRGVLVCGNAWEGTNDPLLVAGVASARIVGNEISGTHWPLFAYATRHLEVDHNAFLSGGRSELQHNDDVRVHHNSFALGTGLRNLSSRGDFTQNWWGDATGPSPWGSGAPATGASPVAPWLAAPPVTVAECDAIATPEPSGPAMTRHERVFEGNPAIITRVLIPDEEAFSIRISHEHAPQGDNAGLSLAIGWSHDARESSWYSLGDASRLYSRFDVLLDTRLTGRIEERGSTIVDAPAVAVDHCLRGCNMTVLSAAGFRHPGRTTVEWYTSGEGIVEVEATYRAGLVSSETMQGDRFRIGVDMVGADAALALEQRLQIEKELWGFSTLTGGGPGAYTFEREGPDGVVPAGNVDWSSPPGNYVWRYEGATVGGTTDALALWIDADLPD